MKPNIHKDIQSLTTFKMYISVVFLEINAKLDYRKKLSLRESVQDIHCSKLNCSVCDFCSSDYR